MDEAGDAVERRPPSPAGPPDRAMVERVNRLIAYHSRISGVMTRERTSLESGLIPVTAYIVVACCEAWYRYPEMMAAIEQAMPAEEIGRRARRPGVQVNSVYLWSIANFFLLGRKVLVENGVVEDDARRIRTALDFWERAARAYRGDGFAQAHDAGLSVRTYQPDVVGQLAEAAVPVADGAGISARTVGREAVRRFSATMMSHLFLLYFDTRVGIGDTGPYDLPDGKTLLVRDYYRAGASDLPWSGVAKDLPYSYLTAGLVFDGVSMQVDDWGTTSAEPADYLQNLVGFSLFTTDGPGRALRRIPVGEIDAIAGAARRARTQHYRNLAAMSRDEKVRAGAYVYFTFLRPFAELAGVANELDWTVPLATKGPVYDFLSLIEGDNAAPDPDEEWYSPVAV